MHRIVHVVYGKANPNKSNGVSRYVHFLARAQKRAGYNVSILGISNNCVPSYPERSFETKLFNKRDVFSWKQNLKKFIQNQDEQTIFHLHGAFNFYVYYVAIVLIIYGRKMVYSPHGSYRRAALKRKWLLKRILLVVFEAMIIKKSKTLHLLADSEKEGIEGIVQPKKTVIVSNGQDISVSSVFSESHSLDNDHLRFGYLGRIDIRTKGLDILLKGFKIWSETSNVNWALEIVGDGPDMYKLNRMISDLQLEENIILHGEKSGVAKFDHLNDFDFLCLTSRNEGLPASPLESMSVGTPVIISSETNLANFIRSYNCGIVVQEKNSPNNVAAAIAKAEVNIRNGEYFNMSNNAKRLIQSEFSWDRIVNAMFRAYE